ncbi:MAG: right-handed parallel beta-helix repeat-containing protein [Polyangiaceae bacterium]|nr:right-handed parallel beta-helix repeat-containing protein [Polyangiaceae bacterium]
MRNAHVAAATGFILLVSSQTAYSATLQVGPGKAYSTPCDAIAAAAAGDTIEVDATGNYAGDVCYWATDNLTIVGVNGRPKIDAAGQNAQGKAIWVIGGANTVIENIELTGATVPDQNGAGIRQEGKNLTVRKCYFHNNEDGILAGDNDGSEILIEETEFAENGYGDGQSHNLYINHVAKLTFRYNYSHDAKVGHLLKSRAAENHILYNRLTQENGTGSYEIDLPNGGTSLIIGNYVQQGPMSENSNIVSYGAEGIHPKNPGTDLFVINNTFYNGKGAGAFVNVGGAISTPAILRNNIFSGHDVITNQMSAVLEANFLDASGDPMFVDLASLDLRIKDTSPCKDAGVDPGMAAGQSLTPEEHYVHPTGHETRTAVGVIDIGAYEIGGGMVGTGGAGGATGGSGGTGASASGGAGTGGNGTGTAGGSGGNDAGSGGGGNSGGDGGCGCRVDGGAAETSGALSGAIVGLLMMVGRRRRRQNAVTS